MFSRARKYLWERRLCAAIILMAAPALVHAQSLSDPTERTSIRRAATTTPAAARWLLQSTLVAADRRLAVINGETVGVGDTIRGARVLQITPYAVRLQTAGGTIELTLTTGDDPKRAVDGGA